MAKHWERKEAILGLPTVRKSSAQSSPSSDHGEESMQTIFLFTEVQAGKQNLTMSPTLQKKLSLHDTKLRRLFAYASFKTERARVRSNSLNNEPRKSQDPT